MKRRTLDIAVSTGAGIVAVALVALAAVFVRDATFARDYVAQQLGEQKITFKAADELTEEEAASACIVANAGQPLVTGKQAECYANEFIGLHLDAMADGQTYAELGAVQSGLRAQVAAAQESNDPALAGLEAELAEVAATRDTKFKGETLRGLLLTSYGFSVFGEKAMQAAIVLFVIAGVLGLLAVAGFVHAFATSKDERVPVEDVFAHEHPVQPHRHVAPKATSARAKGRPRVTR